MFTRVRFALGVVFLLALVVVFVVQPEFWPGNWLWADIEPILDGDGEAVGTLTIPNPAEGWCDEAGLICFYDPSYFLDGGGGGTETVALRNPIVTKFFPADFHPNADPLTGGFRRYGVVLARGDSVYPAVLAAVIAKVNPNDPKIVSWAAFATLAPPANNFFAGKAEAVLAVSEVDPTGNGNGSLALVVSGSTTEHPNGYLLVKANAWGGVAPTIVDGLTGPISVAIDDTAQEVIVVEQTEDGEGAQECAVGQSPVRFFRLSDAYEVRRLCIGGVGDSADMEVDSVRHLLFVARSFTQGKVTRINLDNFQDDVFDIYLPAGDYPAPGLDLDLLAGKGYLAAPELGGLKEFDLTNPDPQVLPPVDIPGDIRYHRQSGIPTGLQEVSVSNFPNGQNDVRRGIVISRSDPINYPNRNDQITRINLVTRNTNRQGTSYQTTVIHFVPQRSSDQSNQEFFLRVKVDSTGWVTMKLKKYDSGTVP